MWLISTNLYNLKYVSRLSVKFIDIAYRENENNKSGISKALITYRNVGRNIDQFVQIFSPILVNNIAIKLNDILDLGLTTNQLNEITSDSYETLIRTYLNSLSSNQQAAALTQYTELEFQDEITNKVINNFDTNSNNSTFGLNNYTNIDQILDEFEDKETLAYNAIRYANSPTAATGLTVLPRVLALIINDLTSNVILKMSVQDYLKALIDNAPPLNNQAVIQFINILNAIIDGLQEILTQLRDLST